MKTCTKCKVERSEADFYRHSRAPDGLHYYCISCSKISVAYWKKENAEKDAAKSKRWREKHPERCKNTKRKSHLKNYGITVPGYDALLNTQGGVCAICEKECASGLRLAVDHIHGTNPPIIRGLLCSKCNQAIGLLNDSPGLLLKAAAYVCKGKEKQEAA